MLAGEPPFVVDSMPAHIMRITTQPPPSIQQHHPEISAHVDRAIQIALAQDPAERFQSATSFKDMLRGQGNLDETHGPSIPETITDDYRVDDVIGRGPVATVYDCTDVNLNVPVAVKLLRSQSAKRRKRFTEEARAQAPLHQGRVHSSVAAIRHIIAQNDFHALVVERVKGAALDTFLDNNAVDVIGVLRLFSELSDALHHAHEKGVLHRNLKPSNVIVFYDDNQHLHGKLTDFQMDTVSGRDRVDLARRLGTLAFVAPELADPQVTPTIASDVFALGVLLIHTFTGSRPPSAIETGALKNPDQRNVLQRTIPPLTGPLEDLLTRMLATRAEARPQSMSEVRDILVEELNTQIKSSVLETVSTRPAWMIPVMIMALLLVVGAVTAIVLTSSEEPKDQPTAPSQPSFDSEAYRKQAEKEVFNTHTQEVTDCVVGAVRAKQAELLATDVKEYDITLGFSITVEGTPQRVDVINDSLEMLGATPCIVDKAKKWVFPKPEQEVTLEKQWVYPLR